MELELLNDQLRKGQANAESEARSNDAAARSTQGELERAEQRLNSMPKRFTESLQVLRDEVEGLEKEKLSLELAKHRRKLQVIHSPSVENSTHKLLSEPWQATWFNTFSSLSPSSRLSLSSRLFVLQFYIILFGRDKLLLVMYTVASLSYTCFAAQRLSRHPTYFQRVRTDYSGIALATQIPQERYANIPSL